MVDIAAYFAAPCIEQLATRLGSLIRCCPIVNHFKNWHNFLWPSRLKTSWGRYQTPKTILLLPFLKNIQSYSFRCFNSIFYILINMTAKSTFSGFLNTPCKLQVEQGKQIRKIINSKSGFTANFRNETADLNQIYKLVKAEVQRRLILDIKVILQGHQKVLNHEVYKYYLPKCSLARSFWQRLVTNGVKVDNISVSLENLVVVGNIERAS